MIAREGTKGIGGLALACAGFAGNQVPRLVQELAVSTLSRPLILQGLKRCVLYKRVLVDGLDGKCLQEQHRLHVGSWANNPHNPSARD